MVSGVYKITNKITNEFYVGSSVDVRTRFSYHRTHLRRNCHPNKRLQKAWNVYKENSFVFEILEECDNYIEREQYFLDLWNCPYNVSKIATPNQQGWKHTDEWKSFMRNLFVGKKRPPEVGQKISKANRGEKHPMCRLKDTEIEQLRKVFQYSDCSQTKLSKLYGISQPYLSRLMREERRA